MYMVELQCRHSEDVVWKKKDTIVLYIVMDVSDFL